MENLPEGRAYFSARGSSDGAPVPIDLDTLRALFLSVYGHLATNGYFDEAFGSSCVDAGFMPGYVGENVESYASFNLMKSGVWPISENIDNFSEADLFDVIEFLYDHVSEPQQKDYHSWNECGYHYSNFDKALGKSRFRSRVNRLLERYGPGFDLNEKGEIEERVPKGIETLFKAQLPTKEQTVSDRVQRAVERFRRYGSSMDDRHKAVRDLADVLEWLRPKIKTTLLKKDEQELFQLANNFGIRHLNQTQRLDYDRSVWLSWMFYHYLATIHASLHLIDRQRKVASGAKAANLP